MCQQGLNAATLLGIVESRAVARVVDENTVTLLNLLVQFGQCPANVFTRGLIVFEGVYGSDWPKLAAAVLMLMFPMLVLFMFLQRYIISGLTSGAVKG